MDLLSYKKNGATVITVAPFFLPAGSALVLSSAAFLVAAFVGLASVIHGAFRIMASGFLQRLLTGVLLDRKFVLTAVCHAHALGST